MSDGWMIVSTLMPFILVMAAVLYYMFNKETVDDEDDIWEDGE